MGADEKIQPQQQQGINQPRAINNNPSTMTQAQFLTWKRQKDANSSARKAEAARKRAEDIAAGTVNLNGRELFIHEPWVFDNNQY